MIKTHKGYVTSKKIGKYKQIIQHILRITEKYAYLDKNFLIKTHKGFVTSKITPKPRPRPSRLWAKKSESGEIRRNRTDSAKPCSVLRSPGSMWVFEDAITQRSSGAMLMRTPDTSLFLGQVQSVD